MAIEHDYFGILDQTASGGLAWDDTVELGDQAVDVDCWPTTRPRVPEFALDPRPRSSRRSRASTPGHGRRSSRS